MPPVSPAEQAEKKPAPASASGVRTVEITGGDDMKYSVTSIPAKPGETLRIRLVSKGTLPKVAMAHNVVVLKAGAKQIDFANAAAMASATGYIPAAMKDQVLAATTMAGPGETVEVTFKVPAARRQLSVHLHLPRTLRRRHARHDCSEVAADSNWTSRRPERTKGTMARCPR